MKHTPTPWAWRSEVDPGYPGQTYDVDRIIGPKGECILSIYGNQKYRPDADRAFIVRACNTHEEILTALRCCRDELVSLNNNHLSGAAAVVRALVQKQIERANNAIAKAEART